MSRFKVKFDDKERLKAHLWLLNSCTVKNPAEDHFKNAIQAAQSANIPVVVTGCVPQGAPKDKFVKGLSTVGVQQIDRVVEVVEETLKGNTVKIMGPKVRDSIMYQGAVKGCVCKLRLTDSPEKFRMGRYRDDYRKGELYFIKGCILQCKTWSRIHASECSSVPCRT